MAQVKTLTLVSSTIVPLHERLDGCEDALDQMKATIASLGQLGTDLAHAMDAQRLAIQVLDADIEGMARIIARLEDAE